MKPSIQHVRELAGKNAAFLARSHATQQQILSAADAECARLTSLIDGISHADVLTDDTKATAYQDWVMQRAALQRLLGDAEAD